MVAQVRGESWCALLMVAGCGRVHFDARADGGAGSDAAAPDGGLVCPGGYTRTDDRCYRLEINPTAELAWIEAEAACEADGPGAHLLVVDDAVEAASVVSRYGTAADAWIGVSDRVTEGCT